MVTPRATLPDLSKLNPDELKALIVSQHQLIVSRDDGHGSSSSMRLIACSANFNGSYNFEVHFYENTRWRAFPLFVDRFGIIRRAMQSKG
jgi:hypothetical protein